MKPLLIIICICLTVCSRGQLVVHIDNRNDTEYIREKIQGYLEGDRAIVVNRRPEFLILILSIDSGGTITKINLMSDEDNRDRCYVLLKALSPSFFFERDLEGWKSKRVFLPVSCLGGNDDMGARVGSDGYVNYSRIDAIVPYKWSSMIALKPVEIDMPGYACVLRANPLKGTLVADTTARKTR